MLMWETTPVIPVLMRSMHEKYEFEVCLGHIASSSLKKIKKN
jgi:hypothetical protein